MDFADTTSLATGNRAPRGQQTCGASARFEVVAALWTDFAMYIKLWHTPCSDSTPLPTPDGSSLDRDAFLSPLRTLPHCTSAATATVQQRDGRRHLNHWTDDAITAQIQARQHGARL